MPSIWRLIGMFFRVLILGQRHRSSMAKLRSNSAYGPAQEKMLEAYRQGDYQTALRLVEGLKELNKASYTFFRGAILLDLGQFEEAEKLLRQNVLTESKDHQLAIGYSSLGQLMLEQGRFDDAMECFTASLRYMPDRGATLRDVAETWLRRKSDPAEALKWAQLAVVKERSAPLISEEVRALNLSENLATLAWAVAVSSRDEHAVEEILSEAIPMIENRAVSSASQVFYHSGRAYAELGDFPKSRERYEEASRRDPQGRWGRAARAALEQFR